VQSGLDLFHKNMIKDRRKTIVIFLVSLLILVLVFGISVCHRTDGTGFISPENAIKNILSAITHKLAGITKNPAGYSMGEYSSYTDYQETMDNLNSVFITMAAGGILALSGAVYQNVFRNPLAAPTMLGVASGINAGLLLFVLHYSSAALIMQKERYLYTYSCALGMLALVLAAGKLAGKRKFAANDMLLVGVVITQLVSIVITYFQFNMSLENLEMFQNFSMGRLTSITGMSRVIFVSIIVVGIIPIYLLRYSLNVISFSDEDAYTMGIHTGILRIVVLVFATLLVTASIIHCGSIGVISMIVPYITRYLYGSDFRKMFYSCFIMGAIMLLICRDITNALSAVFGFIPVGIFVSLIGSPVFFCMLVNARRVENDT
jgi:iron complex transport system permease protein